MNTRKKVYKMLMEGQGKQEKSLGIRQGVSRLESQAKSPKVGEFGKNVVAGQGKSGKIVSPKYLVSIRN